MKSQKNRDFWDAELNSWALKYEDEPWTIARRLPSDILLYFPEAKRFICGHYLVSLLDTNGPFRTMKSDKSESCILELSQKEQDRLDRAFQQYYKARGEYHIYREMFVLERLYPIERFSAPIGLEIEIDNNPHKEVRTFPIQEIGPVSRFLRCFRQVMRVLDDNNFIPLGYEMNMHINFGIFDPEWLWAAPYYSPKIDVPADGLLSAVCDLLFIPNMSQARLEHVDEEYPFNVEQPSNLVKRTWIRGENVFFLCDYRLHTVLADISPFFDIEYFSFACNLAGRVIIGKSHIRAKKVYDSLIETYRACGNLPIGRFVERMIQLPYREYNEKMYRLRRSIFKAST